MSWLSSSVLIVIPACVVVLIVLVLIVVGFLRLDAWKFPRLRVAAALLVIVFELSVLWYCLQLARVTVPGNDLAANQFFASHSAQIQSEVTQSSMANLQATAVVISRWRAAGSPAITAGDQNAIKNSLTFVSDLSSLVRGQPQVSPCGGNGAGVADKGPGNASVSTNKTSAPGNKAPDSTNSPSIVDATNKTPILPDNLSAATASQREEVSQAINRAVGILQQRLKTIAAGQPANPPLTPAEQTGLQTRLQQALIQKGASWFGSARADLAVLLMALGAIGGAGRSLFSIADFIGTRRFVANWTAYYLILPVKGAVLALAFYLVFLAGFVSFPKSAAKPDSPSPLPAVAAGSTNAASTNAAVASSSGAGGSDSRDDSTLMMVCALAIVVGLFSDEASKNLAKIAAAIFTENDGAQAINDGAPNIICVSAVPLFSPPGVADIAGLVARLENAGATDLVPQYVLAHCPDTQSQLKDFSGDDPQKVALFKQTLSDELNKLIQSISIYDDKRFPDGILSAKTKKLLGTKPKPGDLSLVLLNRFLLLDAFAVPPSAKTQTNAATAQPRPTALGSGPVNSRQTVNTVPITDALISPAVATVPPAVATVPPAATTVPPAATTVPPAATTVPPEGASIPMAGTPVKPPEKPGTEAPNEKTEPPVPSLTDDTTAWLVELDGVGFGPTTVISVTNENRINSKETSVTTINKETVRFEYDYALNQPSQTIDVIAYNPPSSTAGSSKTNGQSLPVKTLLDNLDI